MNTKSFRRIMGGLLLGSLPMAAVLSGPLACDKGRCYSGGSYLVTEDFALPPYVAPEGSMTDAGAADGGTADGGLADGGSAAAIPSVEEQCETFCNDKSWRSNRPAGGSKIVSPTSSPITCTCGFEYVDYAAQCIPPGSTEGRRPAGFEPVPTHGTAELGNFFARALQAEAASVAAFRILARELSVHGAPLPLIQAAGRAAAEERGHARLTHALLVRFSGQAVWPEIAPREPRSLWEVAVENEIEGCVNEAYSAFVAAWQTRAAADPWVRAVMSVIAPEEQRHAELAFAISHWMRRRLDHRAQNQLTLARAEAVSQLQLVARRAPSAALVRVAGVPAAASALTFLAHVAPRELTAAAGN